MVIQSVRPYVCLTHIAIVTKPIQLRSRAVFAVREPHHPSFLRGKGHPEIRTENGVVMRNMISYGWPGFRVW